MLSSLRRPLKFFAIFIVGIFFAFPISAMFGVVSLLLPCLPFLWEVFWRLGLGLLILTAIALFWTALKG